MPAAASCCLLHAPPYIPTTLVDNPTASRFLSAPFRSAPKQPGFRAACSDQACWLSVANLSASFVCSSTTTVRGRGRAMASIPILGRGCLMMAYACTSAPTSLSIPVCTYAVILL